MAEDQTWINPKRVTLTKTRWDVTVKIQAEDEEITFIASADSGVTFGDGIFFGTPEELWEVLRS
jgi:hypothetical protein